MTLGEFAKGPDVPDEARPLIEMFAAKSDVLEVMPFLNLSGFVYQGYRQAALQTSMAFRAINAPSTSGAGVVTPFQESTFLVDHDIPIDRALVDRGGDRRRAWEESMGLARLNELIINTIIKGDNTTNNTQFNGLQKRAAMYGRLVDNSGGVSGGAPLSLAQLDFAIQNTARPTHIIAPWGMRYRFIQAARNTTIAGYVIRTSFSDIGKTEDNATAAKPVISYAGLPILFGYEKDLHAPILPFTEVAPGGGSATTSSIYVVCFGENDLVGIQNAPMEIRDFGLLQDGITYNTHFHWDMGIVDNSNFCFTRLAGIQQAAIVT
jgi:hypothetical protein